MKMGCKGYVLNKVTHTHKERQRQREGGGNNHSDSNNTRDESKNPRKFWGKYQETYSIIIICPPDGYKQNNDLIHSKHWPMALCPNRQGCEESKDLEIWRLSQMIKATQGNPKALCKREAERWGQIRRCENGNKSWGDSRPRSKEWSFLKVRQSKETSSPGA